MTKAERSIRIIGRNADVLDRTSGLSGEIFLDATNQTLRLFDGNTPGGVTIGGGSGLTTEQVQDIAAGLFNTSHTGISVSYNDASARIVLSVANQSWSQITGKPTIPTNTNQLTNGAGFLTSVGTISYNDLSNKPTLFSGNYNDLSNKPTIPSLTGYATETYVGTQITTLIGTAGAALNTLGELSDALNDDANFASTVTTALGLKAPSSGATLSNVVGIGFQAGVVVSEFSDDDTLAGDSTSAVPTESAVKGYVDTAISGVFSNPTFTGTATLQQTTEVLNTKSAATGTVTHDFSTGAIWHHTAPSSNFTVNLTNVPTTVNRTIVATLIIQQGLTPYIPNAFQVDGSSISINWLGGTAPSGNSLKFDLVSFTLIIRSGALPTLLGSLSTYG